jgi:hypothetical protein
VGTGKYCFAVFRGDMMKLSIIDDIEKGEDCSVYPMRTSRKTVMGRTSTWMHRLKR